MINIKNDKIDLKNPTYLFNYIKLILSLIVFLMIFIRNFHYFNEINFKQAINNIRFSDFSNILFYSLLGLIPVFITYFYDYTWLRSNRIKIDKNVIFKTTFATNTINNFLSLGSIGSAVIRIIFYKDSKIKIFELTKVSSFMFLSFFTGLSGLFIISLMKYKSSYYFYGFPILVYTFLILTTLYLLMYFFCQFNPIFSLKEILNNFGLNENIKLKILMFLISFFYWTILSLSLWFIILKFNQEINFFRFLIYFSFSYLVGFNIPIFGAFGIFDILFVIGLQSLNLNGIEAISIIIIYRIFFSIIPFLIGLSLIVYELIIKESNHSQFKIEIKEVMHEYEKKIKISKNQQDFLKDIVAFFFKIVIFLASLLMILTSIFPSATNRIFFIKEFISLELIFLFHKTSFIIGLILLIITFDIELRAKSTYYLTMLFLGFATIVSLLKGTNIEELMILIITTITFKITKSHFYRISTPLNWSKIIKEIIISQIVIGIYIFSKPSDKTHFINEGIILTLFIQGFILLWNLYCYYESKKTRPWINQTEKFIYEKADLFLSKYEGTMLSHLIYCGDKYIYISEDESMLISFRTFSDKMIVLGDPIGETSHFVSNLDEFRMFIDLYGYTPVFYQISEKFMPQFHEIGYYFFKLGEDALYDLSNFNILQSQKEFVRIAKVIEKSQCYFEISKPPHSKELMNEIRYVSNQWLNGRVEKSFSLGFFDIDFLNRNSIALLRSNNNEVVAFTSITSIHQSGVFSIDLIRFSAKAPKNSMDYIMLKLFKWGIEQGYSYFYLGMAPLSNVGMSEFSENKEKIAKIVFNNLKLSYNFKGLFEYKDKFHPTWYPKFLAYPKSMKLPFLLISIILVISSRNKKI